MAALAPAFNGLTAVFDQYLLSHVITNAAERARVVAHLQRHWFDQTSPDAFFPGVPVASIYAQGVLKALDLALAGRRVVPLNAWWLLDYPEVKLLAASARKPPAPSVDTTATPVGTAAIASLNDRRATSSLVTGAA